MTRGHLVTGGSRGGGCRDVGVYVTCVTRQTMRWIGSGLFAG